MKRMMAITIRPGATTAAARPTDPGMEWSIIGPPAATSTRRMCRRPRRTPGALPGRVVEVADHERHALLGGGEQRRRVRVARHLGIVEVLVGLEVSVMSASRMTLAIDPGPGNDHTGGSRRAAVRRGTLGCSRSAGAVEAGTVGVDPGVGAHSQ